MGKKLLFISALLLGGIVSAYAQGSTGYPSVNESVEGSSAVKQGAYKTTWQKNRFKDTWYISVGSGVQTIFASDDSKAEHFTDRLTYAPTFTVGKYFSPIWGLRLNFTGGKLTGFNDGVAGNYRKWNQGKENYRGNGYLGREYEAADGFLAAYPSDGTDFHSWDPQWESLGFAINHPDPEKRIVDGRSRGLGYYWFYGNDGDQRANLYKQEFKYVAANANFMFDLLTLFGNYNPKRLFDITPLGGLSLVHMYASNGQTNWTTFGANFGTQFKVRLSDKFNFYLEANATLYPDEFDGQLGGTTPIDMVGQATGGFTYKIGKSTWDVAEPMDYQLIDDLNTKINDLKYQLSNIPSCPDCPKCPEPKEEAIVNKQVKFLPDPVFFRIGKSSIDASEWTKIEKAVSYLKKYPETNVVVTGYADKQTSYPEYNLRLSERRAKAVSTALTEKFNINPLRISINWEGDKVQPFEVNEWNRVVIFIIED